MTYAWGKRSADRLGTVQPVLAELFHRVIKRADLPFDLTVTAGHRGRAEQDAAVASGASRLRWPNSKHNKTPSEAVDVVPLVNGAASWDWAHYRALAPIVKAEWAAMEAEGMTLGWRLEWGGDWQRFPDGPHWQVVR